MRGDFPSAPEITITLNGIQKLLAKLNPNKAAGPDNIKPRILKELSNEIAPILLIIFRKSLETGEVPQDWRNANVTPYTRKVTAIRLRTIAQYHSPVYAAN